MRNNRKCLHWLLIDLLIKRSQILIKKIVQVHYKLHYFMRRSRQCLHDKFKLCNSGRLRVFSVFIRPAGWILFTNAKHVSRARQIDPLSSYQQPRMSSSRRSWWSLENMANFFSHLSYYYFIRCLSLTRNMSNFGLKQKLGPTQPSNKWLNGSFHPGLTSRRVKLVTCLSEQHDLNNK
jgi:hypothetical protein